MRGAQRHGGVADRAAGKPGGAVHARRRGLRAAIVREQVQLDIGLGVRIELLGGPGEEVDGLGLGLDLGVVLRRIGQAAAARVALGIAARQDGAVGTGHGAGETGHGRVRVGAAEVLQGGGVADVAGNGADGRAAPANDRAGAAVRPAGGFGVEAFRTQVGPADGAAAFAVAVVDRLLLAQFQVQQHVEALRVHVAETMGDRRDGFGAVTIARLADRSLGHGALEVLAQDDVHHAGNGVRAVDGRGAVLQDFDALHRFQRDHVQVGEHLLSVVGQAVGRDAPAVDQDQSRGCAQTAQRQARGAGREAAAEGRRHRALAVDGQGLQELGNRRLARLLDVFARHGLDRRSRLRVRAPDVGSRDLDALQRRCALRKDVLRDHHRSGAAKGGNQGARDDRLPEPLCSGFHFFSRADLS